MIDIKNLKVSVEEKEIIKNLNLKINNGEVHAIMGPNGSGKSTLSYALSGKDGYETKGEINYNGENILELKFRFKDLNFDDSDENSIKEVIAKKFNVNPHLIVNNSVSSNI